MTSDEDPLLSGWYEVDIVVKYLLDVVFYG